MNVHIDREVLISKADHPFIKNSTNIIEVSISDIFQKFELEQFRKFIKESLSVAIKSGDHDSFTKSKLEYLSTQLYQPNSIDTLIVKMKSYEQFLFSVPEFSQWMDFLKNRR